MFILVILCVTLDNFNTDLDMSTIANDTDAIEICLAYRRSNLNVYLKKFLRVEIIILLNISIHTSNSD